MKKEIQHSKLPWLFLTKFKCSVLLNALFISIEIPQKGNTYNNQLHKLPL